MKPDTDRVRHWAYVLIAIVALITGLFLGQLGRDNPAQGSRIDWPHPVR